MIISFTPIIVKDMIIFGRSSAARICRSGEEDGRCLVHDKSVGIRDINLYMNTPVAVGDRLYGMSNKMRGQLFTLDATTGKVLWSNQGRFGDNASVYDAGSVVLALNTEADLHVILKTATP